MSDPAITYTEVTDYDVDPDVWRAATVGITVAAADLAITPPFVQWFRRSPVSLAELEQAGLNGFQREPVLGFAQKVAGWIYIAADVSPTEAAEVGAHECFHIAEPPKRPFGEAWDHEEDAAGIYGRRVGGLLDLYRLLKARPKVHRLDAAPSADTLRGQAARGDVAVEPGPFGWLNVGAPEAPHWIRIRE